MGQLVSFYNCPSLRVQKEILDCQALMVKLEVKEVRDLLDQLVRMGTLDLWDLLGPLDHVDHLEQILRDLHYFIAAKMTLLM